VLRVSDQVLSVLCWQRSTEPYAGVWALPSGPVEPGESLGACVARQLASKVGVDEIAHLEQLETRSAPDRDPSQRTIATAYLGVVPITAHPRLPQSARWLDAGALPPMAFDHASVVASVLQQPRVRAGPHRVHDRPAPGHLRRGARSGYLRNQPAAGAPAAWTAAGDRRGGEPPQLRRPAGGALSLQPSRARDHRSVRGAPPVVNPSAAPDRKAGASPGALRVQGADLDGFELGVRTPLPPGPAHVRSTTARSGSAGAAGGGARRCASVLSWSSARRNAATTTGSNWPPAQRRSSRRALSAGMPAR
jgi:ADP-ribose pyrophosphatase YjhB (NUDIX family)